MRSSIRRGGAWFLVVLLISLLAGVPARAAQTVTLTALDGSTEIKGELLEFDGQTYKVRTILGVISVPAAQVKCSGPGCPEKTVYGESFAIAGSNIVAEGLLPALVEGYAGDILGAQSVREVGARENEFVLHIVGDDKREIASIEVAGHGTADGARALAEGKAAIALASRQLRPGEAGLPDLHENERILALGGVVVVVHPDNPMRSLSYDDLAALFSGRIKSWDQLGGPAQPVTLYLPRVGSGTRDLFEAKVMRPRGLKLARGVETTEDLAELSDLVSIDPSGVGITDFAYARAARMLAIRQPCGLVSRPTRFSIKTEEYPLSRRFYAYTTGKELPSHARRLLGFALSDAAQPLIAGAGFVDRSIESQGIELQGARLAHSITSPEEFSFDLFREMLKELGDAQRLSITFRFTRGSSNLDPRSAAEAKRFARLLAGGRYAGKEVLLVGFADSVGEFEVNRELARRRAEKVLAALKAAVPEGALDRVPILVQSYGELTPVGCNETREGRELNRRVEVWLRERG